MHRTRQVSIAVILYFRGYIFGLPNGRILCIQAYAWTVFYSLSTGIPLAFKQHTSAPFDIRIYYSFMTDSLVDIATR